MQDELAVEHPEIALAIHNVNEAGLESGLPDLYAATDLPVLQDDATAQVWTTWGAAWRDVWVVDGDNEPVAVYNLTTYDLSDPVNYQALKDLFVAAAGE